VYVIMNLAHDEMFNGFFIVNGHHWLAAVQQYGFSKHIELQKMFLNMSMANFVFLTYNIH